MTILRYAKESVAIYHMDLKREKLLSLMLRYIKINDIYLISI